VAAACAPTCAPTDAHDRTAAGYSAADDRHVPQVATDASAFDARSYLQRLEAAFDANLARLGDQHFDSGASTTGRGAWPSSDGRVSYHSSSSNRSACVEGHWRM
jgi:hypothetical protein